MKCPACFNEFANAQAVGNHLKACQAAKAQKIGPHAVGGTVKVEVKDNLGENLDADLEGYAIDDLEGDLEDNLDTDLGDGASVGPILAEIRAEKARYILRQVRMRHKRLDDAENRPAANQSGELAAVLSALTRQGDMMVRLLSRRPDPLPAQDPLQLVTAMLNGLKTLNEIGQGSRPSQAQADGLGGMGGIREIMGVMKEFMPATKTAGTLSDLREAMAFAKEISGGGERETSVADVLRAGIETLGKPLADAYLEGKASEVAVTDLPSTDGRIPAQAALGASGQQTQKEVPMDAESARVKMFVAMLVGSASRSEPPELWVEQVLYHVPPDVLTQVLADPSALLAKIDRRVNLYPGWFQQLAVSCRDALEPETEGEGEGDGDGTDNNASLDTTRA